MHIAIKGHNQDEEVDLVLFWFYDEVTNYIEAVPEKPRLRRDTPMMFWKNVTVYPDLDEKFLAKIKAWFHNEPTIDENFFPRRTAEQIAARQQDIERRKGQIAEALAEDVPDDLNVDDDYFPLFFDNFKVTF